MPESCQINGKRHLTDIRYGDALFIGLFLLASLFHAASLATETMEMGDMHCVYSYEDDFSDERVREDSHQQSLFWVKGAAPPEKPALMFVDFTEDNPMLQLQGYGDQPARLGYHVPVIPDVLLPAIPLYVEVLLEVQLLTSPNPYLPTLGYLSYCTSADGKSWSLPRTLKSGANEIHPGLLADHRYIVFLGHLAVIDSLRIRVYREKGTWRVPQDFATIQQAVDAATAGDRIILAAGQYRGTGNYNIDFHGKDLTLCGEEGPESCVIDCQNSGRGFIFTQGESPRAVISDLTIMRGYARQGGGIYLSQSSPTIANCYIRECVCESTTDDQAQGAGIYCQGGQPEIRDCWIYQNRAFGDGAGSQGGGIYAEHSALHLKNCVISANVAEEGSTPAFGGGGLYLAGSVPEPLEPPVLRGNLIVGNSALGFGAGLSVHDVQARIVNCTVVGNVSTQAGGGGGIYFRRTGQGDVFPLVNSSILWGNQAGAQWDQISVDGAMTPNVRFCQVQGGWPGWENSDQEPLFANTETGDYRLQSQSGRWSPTEQIWVLDGINCPCIDTGDPNLDGAAEYAPSGGRINRGAFGGRAQASKGLGQRVFHVDTLHGDDGNIGIRQSASLATIQAAVDQAAHGDSVLVWPGTYEEDIDLRGKKIRVQSAADAATVVAPSLGYAFSFYHAEGPETMIQNFVIRNRPDAIAGIYCLVAQPTLRNLTVTDCMFGIVAVDSGDLVVSNCVLWGNQEGDLKGCRAEYSCIEHIQYGQAEGIGNITRHPRFVDPNSGDYHLQSKFGRYWPEHEVWVVDAYHSPAIDRGDPERYPVEETPNNGGRLNMGAYGATAYASRSAPFADPDLNQDGIVDFLDFAILAENWLFEPH
jgi:hypothetical protein